LPCYFLHHLLKRFSLGAKTTARFLLIDKKGFSVGLCVLSINKNEHPKGFGALEDCPNKKCEAPTCRRLYTCLTGGRCIKNSKKIAWAFGGYFA